MGGSEPQVTVSGAGVVLGKQVKAWPEEAAGLERRTEKRTLMQFELQADLGSDGRGAKSRRHTDHCKPVSSSVNWGQGHVMLDVTPISLLFIPVLATEEPGSEL